MYFLVSKQVPKSELLNHFNLVLELAEKKSPSVGDFLTYLKHNWLTAKHVTGLVWVRESNLPVSFL